MPSKDLFGFESRSAFADRIVQKVIRPAIDNPRGWFEQRRCRRSDMPMPSNLARAIKLSRSKRGHSGISTLD